MSDLPIPVEFRSEIIHRVLSVLRSGESCALVGIGSSGKSNIARHLARADVRLRHLGADAAQTIILYLNCKPLAHRASHDLYLDAMYQLDQALKELDGVFTAIQPEAATLLKEAQDNPERSAMRNLDRALGAAVGAGAGRVVLILDDCDDLFVKAPPSLFSDLRGLRDNHKPLLVYLTLTRHEPAFLRTGVREYEELFELISPAGHTLAVPPYSEADGFHMLKRLAARQEPPRPISDAAVRRLFELSGGHAGLMRTLFFATASEAEALALDAGARLAVHPDVKAECRKILDSLEAEERTTLNQMISQQTPSASGLRRLERRGLIRPGFLQQLEFASPVFEQVLRSSGHEEASSEPHPPRAEPEGTVSIEFIGIGTHVRVNGQLITSLAQPEYEILRCLHERRPHHCSRPELIQRMRLGEHGEHESHGNPHRRLEHYIEHLKSKLGPAGQFIQPEGDGYRLF